MKNTLYRLSLVFALFLGCSEEEKRETAITVIANEFVNHWKFADHHVFISDDNGKVIDSSPLTNGSTVTLRAPAGMQKVNLTIFYVFKDGRDFYNFNTFVSVPRNKTVLLSGADASEYPEPVGTARIEINDFNETDEAWDAVSVLPNYATNATITGSLLSLDYLLRNDPEDAMIIGYRNGTPVYKKLHGLKPNSQVTTNYNEFLAADQLLTIPDNSWGDVFGITADGGYQMLSESGLHHGNTPVTLGYINGYSRYFTRITTIVENGNTIYYERSGDPKTTFSLPELSVNGVNTSPEEFSANITGKYLYKSGRWFNDITSWSMTTPDQGVFALPEIPSTLKSKYNDVSKTDFLFLDLNVVNYTNLNQYEDALDAILTEDSFPEIFERFTVTHRP